MQDWEFYIQDDGARFNSIWDAKMNCPLLVKRGYFQIKPVLFSEPATLLLFHI